MKKIELLSPAGDFESLKSAIQNGADRVYLGASSFSARANATNFNDSELLEAIKYAKLRNVSIDLTLNTLIKNDELEDAVTLAVNSYNLGVDSIIIQDLGLASYLLKNYPQIPLHASTQMTVHNLEGVKQLEKRGFSRVVLARELSIKEIEEIRKNTNIELEVFIHGALCISYSGQCLLSSMIGGRSGNRGLCAQACRLPYELCQKDEKENMKILDKGYILSPRDNFGIEYLPELIKSGVDSLKIEGRMKSPLYVGIVTKIYRKYIDLVTDNINLDNKSLRNLINKNLDIKNENSGLSDREEITQSFNRGGFSDGHFNPNGNKNLIFKDKPNNMGIYIGTISHINQNKGHLTLNLEDSLSIGDKIAINNETYTISELMIDNKNYDFLEKGNIVKIGRMKGNISPLSKVYRIESSKLTKTVLPSFKENKNYKKVKLNGKLIIKKDNPISLEVWSDEGFYKGLNCNKTLDVYPEIAKNSPITKEKIINQICKTGNTEFEFENIDILLDDNLFVQISVLNDLRRNVLEELENSVINKYTHNLKSDLNIKKPSENIQIKSNKKTISLLLNNLNNHNDFENIDKLYIPLKYFTDENNYDLLKEISNKYNTYVYMPNILKYKYNFENIVSKYNIKGFIISHISQLEILSKFNLELIGNYTLNIFNNLSVEELENLKFSTFTISPELNKFEANNIFKTSPIKSEIIVYGKIPVMTNNYCFLGKSNKCYLNCKMLCKENFKFYLKDRKNFEFRIVPDNSYGTTTIYNSKILSVRYDDIYSDSVRIDILDEKADEIQKIINTVKSGERFEGKDYTNGNY